MRKKKFLENTVVSIDIETEKLIDSIVKEFPAPFEKQISQNKELIAQEINLIKESFLRGYDIVLEHASLNKFHVPEENFELKKIDKKMHPEFFYLSARKMLKTKYLQEILEYSPKMMRDIYELGCHFFYLKEFDKCLDIFIFLIVLNPSIYWFWQVIGRAWEEKENLQKALYAFCVAINCDSHRLEGYQDAVRCCVKLKDSEMAIKLLDYGLDSVKMDESPEKLKPLRLGLEAMRSHIKKIGG